MRQEITLDTAAFLDSSHARALETPREAQKRIVEAYLSCCYEELGKAPRLLDGQDVHGVVGHMLPGHFARKDPLAAHAPQVLRAYLAHLNESAVVVDSFEQRQALEHTLEEFAQVVATGEHAHHGHHAPQKPFVHNAATTGRNDPCPCGGGKKFKACHAKQM